MTTTKSKKKHRNKDKERDDEKDKKEDKKEDKKAAAKSKKATATVLAANKATRDPSPARARTRSSKTLCSWETELDRRKKAGLDMDFEFLNNHKEIFTVDPLPFSDVNLEEILLGPGGSVSVTFIDEFFVDRWAFKDDVSWAKGGDTLPNLALLMTLTNDRGVPSYGATLVWVSALTARTTVARAVTSLMDKLKDADGRPLGLGVLCDAKTVPTYCPYPGEDYIVIPPEETEDGVGDLSQFHILSAIRLSVEKETNYIVLPPSFSINPEPDIHLPIFLPIPIRGCIWANTENKTEGGEATTGFIFTAAPDRSFAYTPRVDTRTGLQEHDSTTLDSESNSAVVALHGLHDRHNTQGESLLSGTHGSGDDGYQSTSTASVIPDYDGNPVFSSEAAPFHSNVGGVSATVSIADSSIHAEMKSMHSDIVTKNMRETIKIVVKETETLWTSYEKISDTIRGIVSTAHTNASRPVMVHSEALQDALSTWSTSIRSVQNRLTNPSSENLSRAFTDARAHTCELQAVVQKANLAYEQATETEEQDDLYKAMAEDISKAVDPIVEEAIETFIESAPAKIQAKIVEIGVVPDPFVSLVVNLINQFKSSVYALKSSFSELTLGAMTGPLTIHQASIGTLAETLPILSSLSSPVTPTVTSRYGALAPPASLTGLLPHTDSRPSTPQGQTPSNSRENSRERKSSTASQGDTLPTLQRTATDRFETKKTPEKPPVPDTTTKSSSKRELQTRLDRGRSGRMSFTPQPVSKGSCFQSRVLHKKFGGKVEYLTEEMDIEVLVIDDDEEKPPPKPGVSGYKADNKRPHPPSPESPEEREDEDSTSSIEYCSDAGDLGSEHQEEGDCPPVTRQVKEERSMETDDIKSDEYDPDVIYSDDCRKEGRDTPSTPSKKKTTGTPKKKKTKKELSQEELDILTHNMRIEAYGTDSKEVKAYRKARGLNVYTKVSATNHSDFMREQQKVRGSYPRKLIKNIDEGREEAKRSDNTDMDTGLEKLSGKAFSLGAELRKDPSVIPPPADDYACCFVRPPVDGVRLPLIDRVIPPKSKDGFGAIEMIGLYGLHSPQAIRRRRRHGYEMAFCPLCSYSCNNSYTMNNHIRTHYRLGLRCGFATCFFFTLTAAAMWEHGVSKHAGAGVAKPTEMTKRGKKKDEKKSDDAEAKRVKSGN